MERLTENGCKIITAHLNKSTIREEALIRKKDQREKMEELLAIMNEVKPGVDFMAETDLVDHGVLDSIAIVTLVGEICDAFDVEITPVDIVPENFKTVETIYALIKRLED